MIVKDWAAAAAIELASHYKHGSSGPDDYVTDEQRDNVAAAYLEIIEKHCPFEPDVAYMPVPRCETCNLWTPRVDLDAGQCGLREKSSAKLWPEMYDCIITTADFGCVQWEAK